MNRREVLEEFGKMTRHTLKNLSSVVYTAPTFVRKDEGNRYYIEEFNAPYFILAFAHLIDVLPLHTLLGGACGNLFYGKSEEGLGYGMIAGAILPILTNSFSLAYEGLRTSYFRKKSNPSTDQKIDL